jgi:hypothetical protein
VTVKKVLIGGHLIAEGDPDVVVLGLKAGHPVGVQHVLPKFLENIFSKIMLMFEQKIFL